MKKFTIYFFMGVSVFTMTISGINAFKLINSASAVIHCGVFSLNFCFVVYWLNELRLTK